MALKNKSSWHLYGVLFLGVTLICHVTCSEDAPIRLAAFNIQVFGQTKVSKPSVVDILVQVCEVLNTNYHFLSLPTLIPVIIHTCVHS